MNCLLPILAAAITDIASLRQAVWNELHDGAQFSATGTVTAVTPANKSFWVMDGTGHCYLRAPGLAHLPKAGDRVRVDGHIGIDPNNWQRAFADSFETLGAGVLPESVAITPEQLSSEPFDDRPVSMRGIVENIMADDIDPAWRFISLRSDEGPFLAAIAAEPGKSLEHLTGAEVTLKGIAKALPDGGKRKFKTAQLTIASADDISIITKAPDDPFLAPGIPDGSGAENFRYKSAAMVSRMGLRSAEGTVAAVFDGGRKLLIKTDHGQIAGVYLKAGSSPAYGERIAVAGFPETDLFILHLANAIWKRSGPAAEAPPEPSTELPENFDMDMVLREMLGRTVRITGKVSAADSGSRHGIFNLSCGRRIIPVDASALSGDIQALAPAGSVIEVSGVCIFSTEKWNPGNMFPETKGFTVVPRTAEDLRIVKPPQWWTSGRLFAVSAILLVALAAVLVWNRILGRLIERRSRQLFRAEIAKAESDFRVDERTRLAAELHDSIAQTLTGVSFQIDAASQTLRPNPEAAVGYLDIARRMLLSCREELRRCLWDLRSQALEEQDFEEAIKKTITPHADGAEVAIRFKIPRSRLSDTMAHNILSIIRELCVNAVRHGRASNVRIEGSDKGGILSFSVSDNGTGFDAADELKNRYGHFGLQGIKERTKRMHGCVKIESEQGKGTTVTVRIGKNEKDQSNAC